MLKCLRCIVPLAAIFLAVLPARASGNGQDDLDKATEAKLNANTISDLGEVVRLAESALKKGLDATNTDFANKLLASTLLQRGQEIVKQILAATSSEDFRTKRKFALSDLEKAVQLDANLPEAYLLIGQLYLLPEGDVKLARSAIDKAIERSGDDAGIQAKALLLRASIADKPEEKLAALDRAIKLAPGSAAALRTRGLLLADMNKLEAALADLDKAIALNPDDGPLYETKAIVLAGLKQYDAALAALQKAQELNPDSVMPLVQRARIHVQQGKTDAALLDLNQALAADADNITVLLLRASVYQEKGQKDKAMADVDRAMKLRPTLGITIRTRALLLADDDRFDEAIEELEKLCKLDPKDILARLQLGMLYNQQKKSQKAIDIFTAILAESPDQWRALHARGDAYLNIGKQAEAIADYEKALGLEAHETGVLNNLAWVLATSPDPKLRDGHRAIKLATDACQRTDYKAAHILSTLAAAYAETGDFDTAIKWSTKAVEIGDKEHVDALKKELESYKAKKPWRELSPVDESPAAKKEAKQPAEPARKPG